MVTLGIVGVACTGLGLFAGLLLGAFMARTDLRAMRAELDLIRDSRPFDADASEPSPRAPSHSERR